MVKGRAFAEKLMEVDITLDTDYTSEPIILGATDGIAIQAFIFNDSDAYGTLTFETKVHSQADSWHKVPYSGTTTDVEIQGENLDEIYDFGCLGTGLFRVKYTRLAGNGYMDLHAIRKFKGR